MKYMAFINKKLTIEQRSKFMDRAVKNPISDKEVIPLYQTIDEEGIYVFGKSETWEEMTLNIRFSCLIGMVKSILLL